MQLQTTPIRQNWLANLLIEASPVAVVLTDRAGIIEIVNNVAERWFGYRESELAGKLVETIIRLGSTRDEEAQPACFLSHLRHSDTDTTRELFGRRKDGSEFPVRVRLHPLVTVSGEMVLANVMNLREAETGIEKRIEGERLAAVLEMVSGLSHESRNALQRAQSCLDLLELDLADKTELLCLTERIRIALKDLHNHYEEVKEYAAPIKLRCKSVSLPGICQAAFAELSQERGGHLPSLQINCDPECNSVSVDAQHMQQVFYNLFENAIHASPATSEIEWSCRCSSPSQGGVAQITIRDHGSGLTEVVAKRMFEPFFTTKQQGTGLGLAVCRRIIEAHDGIIDAANHPDGGVVVRIVLPRGTPTLRQPDPRQHPVYDILPDVR